jgi:hypothetical protein
MKREMNPKKATEHRQQQNLDILLSEHALHKQIMKSDARRMDTKQKQKNAI